MNELEECDKKPQHSYKEPYENMGKQNHTHKCNISEDKSCDLEAHNRSMWVGGMGTEGI